MTQEIKYKLEQAAETAWEQDQKTNPTPVNPHAYVYGYKAGAQTILENPRSFGLYSLEDMRKSFYAGHNLCDDEWRDKRKLTGFDEFMEELQ